MAFLLTPVSNIAQLQLQSTHTHCQTHSEQCFFQVGESSINSFRIRNSEFWTGGWGRWLAPMASARPARALNASLGTESQWRPLTKSLVRAEEIGAEYISRSISRMN